MTIIGIVLWEGAATHADGLYDYLINTLPTHGSETERRCAVNEKYVYSCCTSLQLPNTRIVAYAIVIDVLILLYSLFFVPDELISMNANDLR